VPSKIYEAEHWRERAADARKQAARMSDRKARRQMLLVAAGYEVMAARNEERTAGRKPKRNG
jgi:hypothetical protein